jgi:hypothetical protein
MGSNPVVVHIKAAVDIADEDEGLRHGFEQCCRCSKGIHWYMASLYSQEHAANSCAGDYVRLQLCLSATCASRAVRRAGGMNCGAKFIYARMRHAGGVALPT